MIRDLDDTIRTLITKRATAGSLLAGASISFDIPDAQWRGALTGLTINCFLYDVRENREMRTTEPVVVRSADGKSASRHMAPVRVDCAYCITAWSTSVQEPVLEEHRLLSQVLILLLRNPSFPADSLQGALANQPAPYPMILASQEGVKNQAEFWSALDQRLKPSLNYVVTLAVLPDLDTAKVRMPETVNVDLDHK